MSKNSSILYFEREGRENLSQVLRVVKRALRKRPEIRSLKLVIFTGIGEGPALAYNLLREYEPEILAVTFPPDFYLTRGEEQFYPRISPGLQAFFNGVGIKVVTGRLPFDTIEGLTVHNEQMKVFKDTISIFGGSFALCVQAVLQCCDVGLIALGERVIGITGDCAALVTASSTKKFLSKDYGISINEIFCKPRNLTLARTASPVKENTKTLFGASEGPVIQVPKTLPKP